MAYLRGAVTRWVDDAFPGWVEAQLVEADGTVVVLTDEVPVFGLDGLTADTPLPAAVGLACEVHPALASEHELAVYLRGLACCGAERSVCVNDMSEEGVLGRLLRATGLPFWPQSLRVIQIRWPRTGSWVMRSLRWKPSFSRTRNDAPFQALTVAIRRFRPVAAAASTTASAASVA